jgi:hypothetical protein
VERGERAQPHFHVAVAEADAALLGHVGPIGEQLGLDLEPGDDVGSQGPRDQGQGLEHAVDAEFGFQPLGRGLQVEIAGARRPACGQQPIDDPAGILRIGWVEVGKRLSGGLHHGRLLAPFLSFLLFSLL